MATKTITREAYGDRLEITHNPLAKGSQPRYLVTNKKTGEVTKPQGVTTLLGQILAKDLVSWHLDCFEDAILQRLNSLLDHEPLTEEDVAYAKLASSRKRDDGASAGSKVHALVENYLKSNGQPKIDWKGITPAVAQAYGAFVEWFEEVQPNILGVEEVVYSNMYKYAGCYDFMLEIDGKIYLCDLKTTNGSKKAPRGIYPEMFIQLGGYAGAYMEEFLFQQIDGLMVISAKKNGKLDLEVNTEVAWCAQIFRNVISIKNFLRDTTKAIEEGK